VTAAGPGGGCGGCALVHTRRTSDVFHAARGARSTTELATNRRGRLRALEAAAESSDWTRAGGIEIGW